MRPGFLGHRRKRERRRVVDERRKADDVPSGSAVTADFRCSTFVTGSATTVTPNGPDRRGAGDALGVRPSAAAHIERCRQP